jgi:hypothetical protein
MVFESIKDAIDLLHKHNIVFGDLWDPNILYNTSLARVVLIDFDWPRKDGECRYPAMLNPSNAWAEDVLPYSIMHKAHDLWQLNWLSALCNSNA